MTYTVPREADFDKAPGLLDGATSLTLTPKDCDLPYWFKAVAQGTLMGRSDNGHAADARTPDYMREPGALREALLLELGWRSVAEEKATRILAYYVASAPGIPEMDFYATQLLDEARHSMVFRSHLIELGVPEDSLHDVIADISADYTAEVLDPVAASAIRMVRDEKDFIGGVAVFTIVIEGVLAPAAELSERKWNLLDPAAGEIARGAAIDEIRHLTVGSSIIRDYLASHPEYRPRLLEILRQGRRMWDELPSRRYVLHREELFQQGMMQHAELLKDYELFPGCRLLDTQPEQRYDIAERWTDEMAVSRLEYMGLSDAVDIITGGHS